MIDSIILQGISKNLDITTLEEFQILLKILAFMQIYTDVDKYSQQTKQI